MRRDRSEPDQVVFIRRLEILNRGATNPRSRLKCILAEPEVLLTHIGTIKSGQRKSGDGYFIPNALKRQALGGPRQTSV